MILVVAPPDSPIPDAARDVADIVMHATGLETAIEVGRGTPPRLILVADPRHIDRLRIAFPRVPVVHVVAAGIVGDALKEILG